MLSFDIIILKDIDIIKELISRYNNEQEIVADISNFPRPYIGKEIKAIILGADPTHIIQGAPNPIHAVFGLNEASSSPYWRNISKNIEECNLSLNNLYVQNICQNYFTKETSKHKKTWQQVAREFWIPLLREELSLIDPKIPVLITTEFILSAVLISKKDFVKAKDIYSNHIYFAKEKNQLGRDIYALYRHHAYSLPKWGEYTLFLVNKISS